MQLYLSQRFLLVANMSEARFWMVLEWNAIRRRFWQFEFCHEDGNWRVHNIIRYFQDADGKEEESNLMEGMRRYLDEPLEEKTQELSFANMAGSLGR